MSSDKLPRMKVMEDTFLEPARVAEPRDCVETSTVARLFKSHARRLGRVLGRRLRNRDDVQDASQEVFLKLWRRECAGELRDEATAYMHSTALSIAIDCERRRQSHGGDRQVEAELDEIEQHAAPSEEVLHWREGVAVLVSSLQELPLVTQQVFILYHFEGLMHVDIAARLGISLRSVERHMARALAHGKECLKDYL